MDDTRRECRRLTRIVALILIALSVYELLTRLDAMSKPLQMFIDMAIGERIPLERVVKYVDMTIFAVPLYMVGCIICALFALITSKRRTGYVISGLMSAALLCWGLTLKLTLMGEMVRFAKLLPLLLITVLSAIRFSLQRPGRRPRKDKPEEEEKEFLPGQDAGWEPVTGRPPKQEMKMK